MKRPRRPKPESDLPSWVITRVRKKGERLGVVKAKDAAAAIDTAAELWGIDPKVLIAARLVE